MKLGNKNIISLQYGSKSIVKAMFGSKIVWEKSEQSPEIPEEPEIPEGGGSTSPNLIEFWIDGSSFQAEEGMTWESWVDSEYNTKHNYYLDFEIDLLDKVFDDYIVYTIDGIAYYGVQHTFHRLYRQVDPVSISEVIEPKEYYFFDII